MLKGLLEERFKEVSVLPLWLHVGSASTYEPHVTEKACMWSWREPKSLGNIIGDVLARSQKLELDRWDPLIKQIGFTAEF